MKASLIWEGTPEEKFPDKLCPNGWPDGWIKRVYERLSGSTKGQHDRYWYTPQYGYKLRSMTEVRNFFACLELVDGDEKLAWRCIKCK
jgi:hypothetical protein